MNDVRPAGAHYSKFLMREEFSYLDKKGNKITYPPVLREQSEHKEETDERAKEIRQQQTVTNETQSRDARVPHRLLDKGEIKEFEMGSKIHEVENDPGNKLTTLNNQSLLRFESNLEVAKTKKKFSCSELIKISIHRFSERSEEGISLEDGDTNATNQQLVSQFYNTGTEIKTEN